MSQLTKLVIRAEFNKCVGDLINEREINTTPENPTARMLFGPKHIAQKNQNGTPDPDVELEH